MNLRRIRPDDIVRCDVRGQRFYAHVETSARPDGRRGLKVRPLDGLRIPYRMVTPHQVVEHYSKRKG